MIIWSTMEKPKGNSITMRLAEKTDHAIWSWVKQSDGKVGLAIQIINGDIPTPEIPISRQFEVKEKSYENCPPMLTLICVSYEFFEIFEVLCNDLINYSKSLETVEQLLLGIKNRILVWYELFKKDFKGLTKKQILGLAAELKFLKLWISKFKENIGTWVGPDDYPQDFFSKNRSIAIETKATNWVLTEIKISSLFQLDFSGRLYIAVFPGRFLESDDPAATNLAEIIDTIRKDLDPEKMLSLDAKLLLSGYVSKKFDDIYFELGLPIFYRVAEGFPKLTKANVSNSIVDCKYTISLVDLEVYKIRLDEIEV